MDFHANKFVTRYNLLTSAGQRADYVLRASESTIASSGVVEFLMAKHSQEEPAVKLAIARAISRVFSDNSLAQLYDTLLDAVTNPEPVQIVCDKLTAKASNAIVDALMSLCLFPSRRGETARQLKEEIDRHSRWAATNIAHALLYFSFTLDPGRALSAGELTLEQTGVLELILASRRAWRLSGNMAISLQRFGLPTTKADLEAFLAA